MSQSRFTLNTFTGTIAIAVLIVVGLTVRAAGQSPPTKPYSTSSELVKVMQLDPSDLHAPLIPTVQSLSDTAGYPESFEDFYELLMIHSIRYGVDDNFTLRIFNRKTGEVLERYVLENERAEFLKSGSASWDQIDRKRRTVMKKLLDRYERNGHRRRDLTVTWGRLNQVFEARKRDEPYLAYELRLAKMYGLSALSTELSTVETFNQDWLVSRAGARGRYQFMPDMLRRFGIKRFSMATTSGHRVRVYEERHPLLTMEHAFEIMRAYANAVGHEIPGLSAYNTGVGNIFTLTRLYLMRVRPKLDEASVFDAYSWAVTDGFKEVSKRSTFRRQSRAYLPSVHAAYRAVEHMAVDLDQTMHAELVTLRHGKRINLKDLLDLIEKDDLSWSPWAEASSYEAFTQFNQHLALPEPGPDGGIPANGNLVIVNPTKKISVRIFLPLGSAEALAAEDIDVFDDERTRRFDDFTYQDPAQTGEKSLLDWEYESLVDDIGGFGFTMANRERLVKLTEQMGVLAEDRPTPYRKSQALIASMHNRLWSHGPWVKLEKAVTQARNIYEAEVSQGKPIPAN
jgi:hypothetical protein